MSEPSRKTRNNSHVPMNTLYHASLQVNSFLIGYQGLLAAEDERGKGRVWLAEITEIGYIIQHLMARKRLSVAQWAVWEVRTDLLPAAPLKSGRTGVWYVKCDVPPKCLHILETRWEGFHMEDFPHDDNGVYVYSESCRGFRPV